jgi:hypothetical protein
MEATVTRPRGSVRMAAEVFTQNRAHKE